MLERQQTYLQNKQREIGVTLNDIQKQAVLKTEGPLLLLASPGSGKTTTIIMRIGYMIEYLGVHPSRIKAVTFSKASANDMRERFTKFFPNLEPVAFSTIHSLAYEIVRNHLIASRIPYAILDEHDKGQFISKKRILRDLYEKQNKEKITEDQLEELITYISYVKNKMLPKSKWDIDTVKIRNKVSILENYEAYKKSGTEQQLIDFDDMLVMANYILEEDLDVLHRYQARYDYVLTDESQDTSSVQHAIIEKLVETHRNLCVVADEDQSIYSWRGAEPQYLLDFKQTYGEATVLMMTQNYRSTKAIVEPANTFIKQNIKRYDKSMFTENEQGVEPKFHRLPNYHMQAEYIVQSILQNEHTGSVAILYRNNTSAIPLMDAFERANLPFAMKDSSIRFFSHWIVEDVLNFMRLAYNTKNVAMYEKIYRKMNGYITQQQMKELQQVNGDECVFTKLLSLRSLKDYQPELIKKLRKTYDQIDFNKTTPTAMLEIIRTKLGYEKALQKLSDMFGFNYENLLDILNVLNLLARHTETMTEFAQRLKQLDTFARSSYNERGRTSITFSTLHSAKGLEFDTVYIVDLTNDILPAVSDQKEELRDLFEEERRLFYVGVTRAIKQLHLISYKKRFEQNTVPSSFMETYNRLVDPSYGKEERRVTQSAPTKKLAKKYRNEHTITTVDQLKIGESVKHVLFGEGEIVSLQKDMIELKFDVVKKKFILETCLTQGYLEKLQ